MSEALNRNFAPTPDDMLSVAPNVTTPVPPPADRDAELQAALERVREAEKYAVHPGGNSDRAYVAVQILAADRNLLLDRLAALTAERDAVDHNCDYWVATCTQAEADRDAARRELADAKRICDGLAERVAKQSELLSRRAESSNPPKAPEFRTRVGD